MRKGFQNMSARRRREIAAMGGRTGRGHRWTKEEAQKAARRGAALRWNHEPAQDGADAGAAPAAAVEPNPGRGGSEPGGDSDGGLADVVERPDSPSGDDTPSSSEGFGEQPAESLPE